MKNLHIKLTFLGLALGFQACDQSFLETTPYTEFSETAVWSDPALAETFLNNIYFRLDEPLSDGRMKANIVDEAHYRGNGGSRDFSNGLMTQDNLLVWPSTLSRFRSWADIYKNIRYCNIFLDNVDIIPFGNETIDGKTLKDRMTGEAHFLRAYNYFNLVSVYGGVPIIDKVYELDDDFQIPRSTYAETVDFIVSELDKAAELLPVRHSGNNKGRATKGAALALKSRILLYAASDLYNTNRYADFSNPELVSYVDNNQMQRWQNAKAAAKAVIDLGEYRLFRAEPSPSDSVAQNLVDLILTKTTEEDIFIKYFTTPMEQNFGLYTSPNGYHGWGTNAPIGNLVDDFEMRDGTKFDWNNPQHRAEPYKNREPRFYATILYNEAPWRVRPLDAQGLDPHNRVQTGSWEVWNPTTNSINIVYGVDTRNSTIEDWNGSYTGYYCRKYIDPNIDAQYVKQTVTWRFIRYAEILLNYAEACIELGEEEEARKYINMVRRRAGLLGISESGEELKKRYRNERRIELAFEDHRFYDVRRWAIGPEAYQPVKIAKIVYKLNPDKTTATRPTVTHEEWESRSWNEKAYFLPIMRDEMNKNSALIQNPGY